MAEAAPIRPVVQLLSAEEAEESERQYWSSLSGEERVQKLEELRFLWMSDDERRLEHVVEVLEVA